MFKVDKQPFCLLILCVCFIYFACILGTSVGFSSCPVSFGSKTKIKGNYQTVTPSCLHETPRGLVYK